MSFGWKDSEWVDLDPPTPVPCSECDHWDRCPEHDDCEWGWCSFYEMWTKEGESCE